MILHDPDQYIYNQFITCLTYIIDLHNFKKSINHGIYLCSNLYPHGWELLLWFLNISSLVLFYSISLITI